MPEEKSLKEELVELLKDKGLEVAEEAVGSLVKSVFEILPIIIAKSENKYDDLLLPLLGLVESQVMQLVKEIHKDDVEASGEEA